MNRTFTPLLPVLALAGLALLVTACTGRTGTLDAALADEALVEARTPAERELRLCLVGASVAELAADRVTRFDPLDAPRVAAAIERVQARLDSIRAGAGLWLNTEMVDVKRLFVLAAEERARGRLADILEGGLLNVKSLRRAADAAAKFDAVLTDMRGAFERLRAGELTVGGVWDACLGRIAYNRGRVAG